MTKFLAAVLFAALAGCATVGHEIDMAAVDRLQPGASTVKDAVALLGPYTKEIVNSRGDHIYGWSHVTANGFTGKTQTQAVTLVFGPDGKLERKGSSQQDGRRY